MLLLVFPFLVLTQVVFIVFEIALLIWARVFVVIDVTFQNDSAIAVAVFCLD